MSAWLLAPLAGWGRSWRIVGGGVLTLLAALLAVALVGPGYPAFHIPDSHHYLQIARGQTNITMHPFAERQLGPRVAALLGRVTRPLAPHSDPVHVGFVLEALLSLLVLLAIVVRLALRTSAPAFLLLAVLLSPHWRVLTMTLIYPDLFYAAMIAGLLLLIERRYWMAAALLMLPLMLARESTWLTLACFLLAAWPALRWRHRFVAVAMSALGAGIVGRLTAHSPVNSEHLPGAVYVLAKLPWNFLRNVLGILPWSNVDMDLCRVPQWSVAWHAGPVQAVGVCGFSFEQQLVALQLFLGNFGLLPLLLAVLWWRRWRAGEGVFAGSPLLRMCLLYGGAGVLLAPAIGAGFEHLIGYAWPLFWVAPLCFVDGGGQVAANGRARMAAMGFFALHLADCVIGSWRSTPLSLGARTAVEAVLWMAGYLVLRYWPRTGPLETSPMVENPSIGA